MKYDVNWSKFAEDQLSIIHAYYLENASQRIANKIVSHIIISSLQLEDLPYIGQIESFLVGRKI